MFSFYVYFGIVCVGILGLVIYKGGKNRDK